MDYLPQQNRRVSGEQQDGGEPIHADGKYVVVIGGGDTGSDCIGTRFARARVTVTQLEIMPQPPLKEDKLLTWPNWPLKLRTSSSQEEGAEREFAVLTTHFGPRRPGEARCTAPAPRSFKPIPGTEFELKADLVLLAMGFLSPVHEGMIQELGLELDPRGNVKANDRGVSDLEPKGVFGRRHAPRPIAGGLGDPRGTPGGARGGQISDGRDNAAALTRAMTSWRMTREIRSTSRRAACEETRGEKSMQKLFPTSLVGSYPQPEWLIDRKKLAGRFPPRVRAKELWRVAPEYLDQAQDDATILAIRDQERAGLDIITDGEMRRESYSNRFATALEGVDLDNPGTALDRSGHPNPVPRVAGKIRRKHAVEVRDLEFLKANTDRMVKMTVPGPFTMSQQAQNDFYESEEELALDYAAAVNAEIKDLFAAGADVVQIDEPYMQARPEKARQYGLKAVQRALDGVTGTTALHICFGYAAIIHVRPEGYSFLPELAGHAAEADLDRDGAVEPRHLGARKAAGKTIILGVLDLSDMNVETPETVAGRIRRALPHVPAEKIVVAPDCGLKYLPREVAFGKMQAMVDGAAIVRRELQ